MDYKEEDISTQWETLLKNLRQDFGKLPDINAILFLIGVNELGSGPGKFSKDAKQDLIHIGNCRVLSLSGFFELEGKDQDGWPLWKESNPLPHMSVTEQELFLKWHILEYFRNT